MTDTILIIAALLVTGIGCQWLAWRLRIPAILFLLLAGVLAGPLLGWLCPDMLFGCSLDPDGHMYALDAATGNVLWAFASGGSCLSGAAISEGMIFWGSGYSNFGFGTPNNMLYAFGLP